MNEKWRDEEMKRIKKFETESNLPEKEKQEKLKQMRRNMYEIDSQCNSFGD